LKSLDIVLQILSDSCPINLQALAVVKAILYLRLRS
jgi:hypothetical protein